MHVRPAITPLNRAILAHHLLHFRAIPFPLLILISTWLNPTAFATPLTSDTAIASNQQFSRTLDEPLRITFRLADGSRITGELARFNHTAIDGSFGRTEWNELKPAEVWQVARLAFEETNTDNNPHQWVTLGRILLLMRQDQPEAARWAERAFHRAERHVPAPGNEAAEDAAAEVRADITAAIAAARAHVEAVEQDRQRRREVVEQARLSTQSPEARDWPATPWPGLTTEEQRAAEHAMRADAERIVDDLGVDMEPIEGSVFLLYADLPRSDAVARLTLLEKINHRFGLLMQRPPRENPFWGKAVIFIFRDHDTFQRANAEHFGHHAPPEMNGIAHTIGPRVFLLFHEDADRRERELELVRHTTLGLLHRYRTPRRLPPWASEGLAMHLADLTLNRKMLIDDRRTAALSFIREGGNISALLERGYDDDDWHDAQPLIASVGWLMLDLMHRERPAQLRAWINAVKDGDDWREALKDTYGVSHERLLAMTVRYYRVND